MLFYNKKYTAHSGIYKANPAYIKIAFNNAIHDKFNSY